MIGLINIGAGGGLDVAKLIQGDIDVLALASMDEDLYSAINKTLLLGIQIANYSGNAATLIVKITDSSNNLKGYIINDSIADKETIFINDAIVLLSTDKIRVKSDQTDVSFILNGSE